MKTFKILLAVALLLLGACATKAVVDPIPDGTDALKALDRSEFQEIRALPGADFSGYDKILFEPGKVSFYRFWERDMNRNSTYKVQQSDKDRITAALSRQFGEQLAETFTGSTLQQVEVAGPGVLRINPDIVDLYADAPDLARTTNVTTISDTAGEMVLDLKVSDAVSGELLIQVRDKRRDVKRGQMRARDRTTNFASARLILRPWSENLRTVLEDGKNGNLGN